MNDKAFNTMCSVIAAGVSFYVVVGIVALFVWSTWWLTTLAVLSMLAIIGAAAFGIGSDA